MQIEPNENASKRMCTFQILESLKRFAMLVLDDDAALSKKSSKRGLTRRPLFLVRVESLVCTVEMIGPSRSAGAGRDALPREPP